MTNATLAQTVTIPASLYKLLCNVAEDAWGISECNCGDPCDGDCTHALSRKALDAVSDHDALGGAAPATTEVQALASSLLEPVLPTFDGGDCANWMNDAQELARRVLAPPVTAERVVAVSPKVSLALARLVMDHPFALVRTLAELAGCDAMHIHDVRATVYALQHFPQASAAFQQEHPWCGWTVAFAHGSDWDTTGFVLDKLVGLNFLLTTADGRSRGVVLLKWNEVVRKGGDHSDRDGGILVQLHDDCGDALPTAQPEFVSYQDIRELVIY